MEVRLRMGTRDDPTFTGRSESYRWGAWAVGSALAPRYLHQGLESPTCKSLTHSSSVNLKLAYLLWYFFQ